MYVSKYCKNPPSEVPMGVSRQQTIKMTEGDTKFLRMKLFVECDGERKDKITVKVINIPERTKANKYEEFQVSVNNNEGMEIESDPYQPIPEVDKANTYQVASILKDGDFYYKIIDNNEITYREELLDLNDDDTFSFAIEGLRRGFYYLYIYFNTKESTNRFTFPIIVTR